MTGIVDTHGSTHYLKQVQMWMERLYIGAEGAGLRKEDRLKSVQVASMLVEIERAVSRLSRRKKLVLVDAAAGKSYVALLAAKLVLEPCGRDAKIIALERDPRRVELSRRAAAGLGSSITFEFRIADAADPSAWPDEVGLVTALHACGPAADAIIERTIAARATFLLLAPCCTGKSVPAAAKAEESARALNIPRQAPVRRRFIQACVDAARTRVLEAGGYETEVVEFVRPTITPHNLLWRARRTR